MHFKTNRSDLASWLDAHHSQFAAIRQDIHAYPELGMQETRTASLVAKLLRQWGVAVEEEVGGTGVIGTIEGRRGDGRAIGLRADLDALPIEETTDLSYASKTLGQMHACGHDGHTAMLLGAAKYLAETRDFSGRVHVIFQPAEETLEGAQSMIDAGLFDRFPCEAVYGLHNTAGMPIGTFGTVSGPMLAAADTWSVVFTGTGGHGGVGPHLAQDVTYSLGHFILGLQGIIGRNVPPTETAVLSIGAINGGRREAPNVIPASVSVDGTARTYSDHVRDLVERRIGELANSVAAIQGCRVELNYRRGVPALVNHPDQTQISLAAARDIVGTEKVNDKLKPTTGAEDFAALLRIKPGAYMRIGNGIPQDGKVHATHTSRYDFNDAIIPLGIAYWVALVDRELNATQQTGQRG